VCVCVCVCVCVSFTNECSRSILPPFNYFVHLLVVLEVKGRVWEQYNTLWFAHNTLWFALYVCRLLTMSTLYVSKGDLHLCI
jgi:hypothetical protein